MTSLSTPHDAGHLARSWLTAYAASNQDADLIGWPYRSIEIEHHDDGIRTTATDSHVIATVWCPEGDTQIPPIEQAPDDRFTVYDEDHRGVAFWKHVAKLSKDAAKHEDAPVPHVTLTVRKARPLSQLTLFGALDQFELLCSLNDGDETVSLALRDGGYPEWRRIIVAPEPEAAVEFGLHPRTLATVAKVGSTFGENFPLVVMPSSDNRTIMRFHTDELAGEPTLRGAFSLVRTDEADE